MKWRNGIGKRLIAALASHAPRNAGALQQQLIAASAISSASKSAAWRQNSRHGALNGRRHEWRRRGIAACESGMAALAAAALSGSIENRLAARRSEGINERQKKNDGEASISKIGGWWRKWRRNGVNLGGENKAALKAKKSTG